MELKKISIIVPVYNEEKYIRRCIKQLLNQTYENIEIIFINDGSTDNTKKILEEFLDEIKIKIYHKKNSGVSNTRNVGINIATGDYISFVDSDDEISIDYCAKLISGISNSNLAISGYNIKKENIIKSYVPEKRGIVSIETILAESLKYQKVNTALWNKMFSLNIIKKNNILFRSDISIGEDMLFLFEYCKHISDAYIVKDILYTYYEHANSTMLEHKISNSFKESWYSEWKAISVIEEENNHKKIRYEIIKKKLRVSDKLLSQMYSFNEINKHYSDDFLLYLRKYFLLGVFDSTTSANKKISMVLNAISPLLNKKIKKILKKERYI